MKKSALYILFLVTGILLLSAPSVAQENVKIKRIDFRIPNKEGFNVAWKNIRTGNKYFVAGKGTYRLARENYLNAAKYNSNNAALNYKIGVCYLYTDNKYEAVKYLKTAYLKDHDVSHDIQLLLGRAHQYVLEFDKAIDKYNAYKKELSPKEIAKNVGLVNQVNRYIEECMNGKDLVQDPKRVIISDLGKDVNSVFDDYSPVLTNHDSVLFFTSRRNLTPKSDRSRVDNKYKEGIYFSKWNRDKWGKAESLGKKINGDHNTAIVDAAADGKKLFIYLGYKNHGDIAISKLKKGKWKSPHRLPGKFNSKYKESSISFSKDGETAYFVSDREKETLGGKDIFKIKKDINGRWQRPVNLGDVINTPYDEEAVYLDPDTSLLYFSSKGHNSMGGYDVFVSSLDEYGEWSLPVNLGYPVNTPDDELFYITDGSGKYGYYATNRENGLGEKDIYKITYLGSEKEMVTDNSNQWIVWFADDHPTLFSGKTPLIQIDSSVLMKGLVYDSLTKDPVMAKLELIDTDRNKVVATSISGQDGKYQMKLPEKKKYGVEITAKGYLFYLDVIDPSESVSDELYIKNFVLTKLEVGTKVVLKNIFFEFSKSTLKPESYTELSNVVKFMKSNPGLRLEISGHTDNIGSLKANTKLSEARAKAVVDYMVSQGIDPSRLEYKGYAFTQPIAPNDTPKGREQNRRVEFKIISK